MSCSITSYTGIVCFGTLGGPVLSNTLYEVMIFIVTMGIIRDALRAKVVIAAVAYVAVVVIIARPLSTRVTADWEGLDFQ